MCKTKASVEATEPSRKSTASGRRPSFSSFTSFSGAGTSSSLPFSASSNSSSSVVSASAIRSAIPSNPVISVSEISAATASFRSNRLSSSSSAAWRCRLRGRDVAVFQHRIHRRREELHLHRLLSSLCKSHHSSIADLLGASLSGDCIYLVYEHVPGATLSAALRHPQNPSFTVLSTWISRIQVAADLADGLLYIHRNSGILRLIHNRLSSSSVILSDPSLRAKICHFGAAALAGELPDDQIEEIGEITPDPAPAMARTGSSRMKVKGTRGYMAPEFLKAGILSQKADVYAFGVLMLEILSGEEALRYRIDEERGDYERVSVVERAAEAAAEKGLRRWVDGRLRDSFPLEVAERMARVALECVREEPERRPEMEKVAAVVSTLYLESVGWAEKMRVPTEFSVSMAPR